MTSHGRSFWMLPIAALALTALGFAAPTPAQAQTSTTSFPSTFEPTVPTVPKVPPPPVVTTPNPPPRMAIERMPDMRDLKPVGRIAPPVESAAFRRRPVINRLENRSTTLRAADQELSLAATPNNKAPAIRLLETAKPIL